MSGHTARLGFTLAEVLITLGIIGVVAALTLPSVINKYQNQVYLSSLKKVYSTLQNAHLRAEDELGEAKYWELHNFGVDKDNSKNEKIGEAYARYLVGKYCGHEDLGGGVSRCNPNPPKKYRVLNGESTTGKHIWYNQHSIYGYAYQYNLTSGGLLSWIFANNSAGGQYWPLLHKKIKILYILDVNGAKKPNQIGRDIYYFMLNYDKNNIVPYYDGTSDCKKDGYGFSCAYDVIINGWNFPKDYPY